jgi:3-hydroxyacyl-CoA dehydrogenase
MFVFKGAVVGAGTMGGEIAQVIASAGIPVVLKDVEPQLLEAGVAKARSVTEKQLGKLVKGGRLDAEAAAGQRDQLLSLITSTLDYDGLGDVDFVVEAVPERMEVKHAVFAELDACTPGHAILASNTSGLSITEIADVTGRPEKVVGFHFFWPASRMRLVEVVRGEETSPDTLQTAANFAQALRKTAIRCEECPGFVVNRILTAMGSEVWRHQEESGDAVQDIDRTLVEAGVVPMGPFYLADMSGLDTVLKVAQDMRDAYGERFHVHGEMEALVGRGDLGRKSGKGFYEHG